MRDSYPGSGRLPTGERRGIALVVAGLVVWTASMITLRLDDVAAASHILAFSRYAAAECFVAAALLHLLCWRSSHAPASLRLAITLAAVGAAIPVLTDLAPWTIDGRTVSTTGVITRVLVLSPVLLLAVTRRDCTARGAVTLLAAGGFTAALLHAVFGGNATAAVADLCLLAGWVAFAVGCTLDGNRAPGLFWTFAALSALTVGEAARLLSVLDPRTFLGIAPGLDVAAGALVLVAGIVELRATWQHQRSLSATLSRELASTHELLEHAWTLQRTRLHDARSTVAGVIGASTLLSRSAGAQTPDLSHLQRLIAGELTRLQHVLDVDAAEAPREFDVLDALAPVLAAHQLERPDTVTELEPVQALGRPHATATALANLLRNARVHAPGAATAVRVRRRGDLVEIVVEDDGRGIPHELRREVLRPGVRGAAPDVPGDGLGLPSAAAAMTRQGGSLELGESSTGGVRATLVLPAAVAAVDAVAC